MTKSNPKAKTGKLRGTKVWLAALAVTATVTGWAWLTNQETALGETTGDNSGGTETRELNRARPQPRSVAGTFRVQQSNPGRLPDLSSLPVRGLRSVPNSPGNASRVDEQSRELSAGTTLSSQFDTQSQQSVPQITTRRKTRSSR